jgi:molybdopterin/thiamine biosynthesis adenylyltransferase
MSDERFNRQILAFGREGQEIIGTTKVGIIGVGGMGALVAQMLAHLGTRDFVLVDDDVVEESNLNRLVGATYDDVKEGSPKVEISRRLIKTISNSKAKIELFFSNVRSLDVLKGLSDRAVIFGCVDNDSARLILSEYCAAYGITLIDCASQISLQAGVINDFGGRVIVARPGDFCPLCANQVDVEMARQELESESERQFRRTHGYGLGDVERDPAVISLNGVIASLAVTEFLMLVTALREPNRVLTYKGIRGIVTTTTDAKKADCYICNYVAGKREEANVERYCRIGLPNDLPT